MAARPHLTGLKFGRLYVTGFYASERGSRLWSCICDCGGLVTVPTTKLVNGLKQSCGCLHREMTAGIRRTHGRSRTPEHKAWNDMKARCLNPSATGYADYGGRGVQICARWLHSFEGFFEDMGVRPAGMSLERVDVNGPYDKNNCRWATRKDQQRNKRNTRFVTLDGITASLSEHCERRGAPYGTTLWRLNAGWPVEVAFTYRDKRRALERATTETP